MSYFTLKNGMKLYYEDCGKGPTVIMMHGWTSNHTIYTKPVKKLQSKGRFIIYDHRGHNKSRNANLEMPAMETLASDLNEIITGLSLSDVTLVGWSMGAGVAMNYIRQYGCGALRQVVLCDMTPKQINDKGWKLGLYKGRYTQDDIKAAEGKSDFELYKKFAAGAKPSVKKIPGFLLDRILKKRLMLCDAKVLTSLSKSMKSQDNRDVMELITVPFTYFYSVPGSLFSPDLEKWYREKIKTPFNSVPFPDSSHLFISEYPDKFADEIGKLL